MATILVSSFGDGTASLVNATAAYNAASTGDTILFPLNGSATWSSTLTVNKSLIIDGNGTTITAGTTLSNGFFYITNFTSTVLMRITGFTFNSVDLTGRILAILDNIDLTNLRIDHNTFNHSSVQIEVGGSKGVFDHNNFYNGNSSVYFTAGSRLQADNSWVNMIPGMSDALFFENNNFIYDSNWLGANENNSCFDTYNGGKLVIRYNSFIATGVPGSWTGPLGVILLHGSAAGGATTGYWQASLEARRGQPIVEIYNNTVNAKRADFLAQLRGSSNLIYNNILDTTAFNPRVIAYEEEQYETQWNPLRTSWPAEDQVHNTFLWNNTLRLNGTPNIDYFEVSTSSTGFIQQNRDYWLHAPQGSGGYEYFSGLNGSSNSYPTNGILYPTSGTMLFTGTGPNAYYGYTAYIYPHPLQITYNSPLKIFNIRKIYNTSKIKL